MTPQNPSTALGMTHAWFAFSEMGLNEFLQLINETISPKMKRPSVIRVGIFDQIVSGGGVRVFTTKLLEEFSRQAGGRWHFHLMWPHFDSSNNFLPRPRLPETSFERIESDDRFGWRDQIFLRLDQIFETKRPRDHEPLDLLRRRVSKIRQQEQEVFRSGNGAGLRWLDQRIHNFDLVFIPYPYLTLPSEGAWLPSKPVVITLHDLAHEFTETWGAATLRLRHEARAWTRFANLVIFSSDFVRQEAQKLYGLPVSRAQRIFLSPAKQNKSQRNSSVVLRRYGLKKHYVFTLGWKAKHKRVETIIEGFALFKQRSHLDISLVIAGPRTESLLNENLFGLEVGKNIFALGYVRDEDIPDLYRHAAVVVTASSSEAGLNSMIFDAMTHERPIICSNIPQFVERLGTNNALAIVFDPSSPRMLSAALCEHFENPSQAELRVKEAKKFASERTLAAVASDYLAAFESVL